MGLGLLVLACSHPRPEEVVVSINDFQIRVGDLQKSLKRERPNYQKRVLEDKRTFLKLKKKFLREMIDRHLLIREATEQGTHVSEEELQNELRKFKGQYTEVAFQEMLKEVGITNREWTQRKRDNLIVRKYLDHITGRDKPITSEMVKEFYKNNKEQFKVPKSVRVRQIVTDSKEKAESILRRLRKGENFAKLAQDASMSPDRKRGGDLGFIQQGNFPREFEVCFSMNPGEISPIIPSLYGFHVFKVLEKAPARTLPFNEVEESITITLKQQVRQEGRKKLIGDLRSRANIQVNEDILKRVIL